MDDYRKYIGLKKGTVCLADHSEYWKLIFQEEASQIQAVLQDTIQSIHHVGSTAIPNIKAKPIIDILIGVEGFSSIPIIVAQLEQLGYIYKGENGIPDRHYFSKGEPRCFHIHLTLSGNAIYNNHLHFLNHLKAHPNLAKAYEKIKMDLAAKFQNERLQYTEGKDEFIQSILKLREE